MYQYEPRWMDMRKGSLPKSKSCHIQSATSFCFETLHKAFQFCTVYLLIWNSIDKEVINSRVQENYFSDIRMHSCAFKRHLKKRMNSRSDRFRQLPLKYTGVRQK